LGFGIGCLLGGVVAEHFSYNGTFWMVAIENAAAVVLFFAASKSFFEKRRRVE
jgi:predicted MFS family arabinose efflux permease